MPICGTLQFCQCMKKSGTAIVFMIKLCIVIAQTFPLYINVYLKIPVSKNVTTQDLLLTYNFHKK